ncbi:unnamed protein product [Cyprideis torosa]|uniref:Uncharacterized protein n=1 Tax=Cyprideis torosa TaxID=163714 RepID=A0A7R8ZR46_9CRUS|nr:unnamed protein product [Cyprideis torosa]CAG0898008.1 unnamed protein product [Cyprideis torosa]
MILVNSLNSKSQSPPTDNRLVPPAAAGDPLPPAEGNTASSSAPRSVERRESNRFHTAKKLIRSLRPGSHGWADVTSSSNGEGGFAAGEDSLGNRLKNKGKQTPSDKVDSDESSFRSLDRGDPRYLSEGKGARRRRSRWQSEKELRPTNSVTLQHPKSSGDLERRPPTSSASASTLPSLHHSYLNVLISEDSSAGAGAGAAEVEEGHSDRIYQNLPSQPSTLPARGGRHNRVPSDEGRMESKKSSRSNGRSPADPVCPASSTCDSNDSSSSPVSSSSDEPYQRLLIDKEGGGARLERGKERRSFRKLTKDSGYETSNYAESDYVNMDNLSDIQSRESQQPKMRSRGRGKIRLIREATPAPSPDFQEVDFLEVFLLEGSKESRW